MIDWPALAAANAPLNAFVDFDNGATGGDGPLRGLSCGIKSNIMVKGLPWTGGMGLHRARIASRDAKCVAQLRGGGAAILGTLNMHEAALGATTDNAFYGRTINPHRDGFTPGGSSGGSGAAVAAGLCDFALGSDTLGSIRIPAAYCGVYGLKPTNGAVSHDGLAFLEPGLDCIGPLARSLDVLERVWWVIGARLPKGEGLERLVLLDNLGGVDVHSAVRAGYQAALAAIDLPATTLHFSDTLTDIRMAGLVASGHWLIDDLGSAYHANNPDLSDELKRVLAFCTNAQSRPEIVARTRETLCAALGHDGVLIMPSAPQPAFAHGTRAPANLADFTALANIAGLPALAMPAGRTEDGLPLGVQLVGAAGSETSLFALARTLDAAIDAYRPPARFGI